MTESSERDRDGLQAEIAKLRQALDSLVGMARQGLPVAEARAQARERMAARNARSALSPICRLILMLCQESTAMFTYYGMQPTVARNPAGAVGMKVRRSMSHPI